MDIWLLGMFVNSSCDIKINIKIVQNCCRNLVVRGLLQFNTRANAGYRTQYIYQSVQ